MHTKSRNLVLASAISLALTSFSGTAFADVTSQELASARQESQISTTYSLSPYLRADDLKVSVNAGAAKLTGTVDEDVDKDLAKQIALGVKGIKSVDNQIKVEADYVSPARTSRARSFGEYVDDATITATVKSKLLWSKHTEGLDMDVDTQMGTVKLTGGVTSDAARKIAGNMALDTRGVVALDNQLVVNSSKPVARNQTAKSGPDTSQAISDSWITTKVKSTYLYSSNVENGDISVSTKDGNVTLSGKVGSGAELTLATELAQNIRGVKSVNATALTF